eukprot:scaffold24220_cov149-Amphora_coffeaeformis.AAC.1
MSDHDESLGERISDDAYKSWLLDAMTAEEFNGLGAVHQRTLLTQFQQWQQQQQQQQQQQEEFAESKTRKRCKMTPSFRPISNGELWQPLEVIPPKIITSEFVCSEYWLSDVELEIIACLQRSDTATDQQDDDRIPPKALMRCSWGGKKRTLYAIANRMKGYNKVIHAEVTCLYVSFNDSSSLQYWEQENPLQALLRCIAFRALSPDAIQNTSAGARFFAFLKDKPIWEEELFVQWLANTPCVLLIDEINNLDKVGEPNSVEASKFGQFIKNHFLSKEN